MIDFSNSKAQQALATAAERTKLSPQDIAAWANVASLDDAAALLEGYRLANTQVSKDWLAAMLAAVQIVGEIAGAILPIVNLASSVEGLVKKPLMDQFNFDRSEASDRETRAETGVYLAILASIVAGMVAGAVLTLLLLSNGTCP